MYAESIGHDIKLIEPTKDEDLRGIDAKFILNNKYYYLQVKQVTITLRYLERFF